MIYAKETYCLAKTQGKGEKKIIVQPKDKDIGKRNILFDQNTRK